MLVESFKSKSKNGSVYQTWLVRESFRTDKGPRSRTLCHITKLPLQTRQLIIDSLKGNAVVNLAALLPG